MFVLAIETSASVGSVAILEADSVLAEQTLELGRKHAQSLIPAIQQVLDRCGRSPHDLGLIAVSIGPGSYTGLRVGVVCAKTFAYLLKCPLVAVDTLLAIACNSPPDVPHVDVIADAQREDLFVGRYERSTAGPWVRPGEIRALRAADWGSELTDRHTVSGPGLEKYGALAQGHCRILPPEFRVPHAACVARLGLDVLAAGQTADPWTLQPLYLRRSSAEFQWEKLHPGKTAARD